MSIGTGLIYLGFYGAIAVACYITKSGWPLLAMVFTPSVSRGETK